MIAIFLQAASPEGSMMPTMIMMGIRALNAYQTYIQCKGSRLGTIVVFMSDQPKMSTPVKLNSCLLSQI